MKLLYLANVRLPSERAHAFQIMQMCSALAAAGVDLTLVHPRRDNYPELKAVSDVWVYYGVQCNFARLSLPSLDLFDALYRLGFTGRGFLLAHLAQLATFLVTLAVYLLWRRDFDWYYTREPTIAALLLVLRPNVRQRLFYEAHTMPVSRFARALQRWVMPRLGGIVAITQGLADDCVGELSADSERLLVAPDAVNLERFADLDQATARERLGIAREAQVVVYTGHFYAWKGVPTLIAAMRQLQTPATLYLVGGTPEAIAELRASLTPGDPICVVGWAPAPEIPVYLAAADVFVLPNSGREAISRRYTSPLKLFEYMAARRPIVASDLPALREVLSNGHNALLVLPDDPAALARGLEQALTDKTLAEQLAAQGHADVQTHTWDARAAQVLDFMKRAVQ